MGLLYNKSSQSWVTLLVGMVLGGALVSTITLFFWSLSPPHETVMLPRARTPLPLDLAASIVQAEQIKGGGGGGANGGQCTCGQVLESKHQRVMGDTPSSQYSQADTTSSSLLPPGMQQPLHHRSSQPIPQQLASKADRQGEVKRDTSKEQVDVPPGLIGLGGGGRGGGGGMGILKALEAAKEAKKSSMVVAVITDGIEFSWPEAVYETWGHDLSQLMFYVGSHSNISTLQARALGLQLFKLYNSVSSLHIRLSVLKHLGEYYLDSHQWFVVVTQDTYVHVDRLKATLERVDPEVPLILGPPPDCLAGGGGRGVIVLSRALLALLTPNLKTCLAVAMGIVDNYGSAELESCVGEHLKTYCSPSSLMHTYFVEAVAVRAGITSELLQSHAEVFSSLLTYQPLPRTQDMYLLHYHYKKTQLMAAIDRTRSLEQVVKEMCTILGSSFSSTSSDKECCPSICSCQTSSKSSRCPPNGVVLNVPAQFQPRSIYDYLSWEYFDAKTMYPDQSAHPSYKLKLRRDLKIELQQALTRAVQKNSETYGRPLKFKQLVNGWVRHNPFVGNEYIVDYILLDGSKTTLSKRAHLVRPLAKNYLSVKDQADSSTIVNIVVPITKVSQRFKEFMSMYEQIVLISNQKAGLVLSVYGKNDVIEVNSILARYRTKYQDMLVKVVEGKGEFSRAKALHLGLSQLHPHELAFICDVDMTISHSFLDRCRSNTLRSTRVYYPEFFKLYNLDYVYWNRTQPYHVKLMREHGHWAYYSFGMLCIYKSDYDSVGGMDTKIVGWGGEDVTFFQKIVRNRLGVMRAPDVGLSHRWHPKHCAKTLSARQYKHCQSSRQENLADRRELARFVYELGPLKTATTATTSPITTAKRTTPAAIPVNHEHEEEEMDEQDYNL